MNELIVSTTNTLDSRDVAVMVDKNHTDLLRDIRRYAGFFTESKIALSDFFQESSYMDSTGRTLPCYHVTRKGCEFIANKLTGKKGTLFTAAYINKFHEMEAATTSKIPRSLPEALRLAADLAEQNTALSIANAKQERAIAELKPKAAYVDWILTSLSTMTTTAIAKDYGMSATEFNRLLYKMEIQYKQSGQWFLYRPFQNEGYTHSETVDFNRSDGRPDVKTHTKWTQKGRLWLYERLKANGILPMIERNNLISKSKLA